MAASVNPAVAACLSGCSPIKVLNAPTPSNTFTRTSHATLVASIAKPLRWLAPVLDRVTAFIRSTPGQRCSDALLCHDHDQHEHYKRADAEVSVEGSYGVVLEFR
jgi:hypothetical protein